MEIIIIHDQIIMFLNQIGDLKNLTDMITMPIPVITITIINQDMTPI